MVSPENLTDDELLAAINQLESEVAMPGPSPHAQLKSHRSVARERGIY